MFMAEYRAVDALFFMGIRKMKIIDMHCDTISELADAGRGGCREPGDGLMKNRGQLDLERMQQSGYLLQNFALFVDIGKCAPWTGPKQVPVGCRNLRREAAADAGDMGATTPWGRLCALYEVYRSELENNKDVIAPVLCYEDILRNEMNGKMSALLTVEEGAVCGGSIERLWELYGMGVRMLTITWNYQNELGWPARCSCSGENRTTTAKMERDENVKCGSGGGDAVTGLMDAAYGLTETGRNFVIEMERLGMIPDVSHLSDAGFDAVWECSKKPFVASHSNAREVCPSLRNLTDDRIRRLADRGGCMGLNYYDRFLVAGGSENSEILWEALVRQARHITAVGGMEVLGLGSDFDGIPTNPAIPGAEIVPVLWERLKTAGFTESQLDGFFWKNVLRLYQDTL